MKVLVANRGEIACRVLRTLGEMGVPSVAVHVPEDREMPHVRMAGEAVELADYLDGDALVAAARRTGADAVHPGYGFLSQSAAFVRACDRAGITFIGPTAEAMETLGDKRASRAAAEKEGVPVIPGAGRVESVEELAAAAKRIGYPVLVKAAGGGGGKGMRLLEGEADARAAFEAARREAEGAFGDGRLLVEKRVRPARHVEVQILGDGKDAVALGERECSLQRRFQKVVEEAPSPGIGEETRSALREDAVKLARAARYRSAGTVEFLVGGDGRHYFLEVNSRLQVEHGVTEAVRGLDLVRAQIELAAGGALPGVREARGHAIEARIYAEDPFAGYLPQTGRILMLDWPQRPGVRIDAGVEEGTVIGPRFDPLLAKVIAWAEDRDQARRRLIAALKETVLLGVVTNLGFLLQVLGSDDFAAGNTFVTTLESRSWERPPVPEAVAAAARRLLAVPPGGDSAASSPWTDLGGFRVGS